VSEDFPFCSKDVDQSSELNRLPMRQHQVSDMFHRDIVIGWSRLSMAHEHSTLMLMLKSQPIVGGSRARPDRSLDRSPDDVHSWRRR
jgi:hypothetical protein